MPQTSRKIPLVLQRFLKVSLSFLEYPELISRPVYARSHRDLASVLIQFVLDIVHYIPAKHWRNTVNRIRYVPKTLLDVST